MTKTEIMRAWFDNIWNRGIESTIDELLAPDMIAHGLGDADLVGREQFREFYRAFRAAFPTVDVTLTQVLESGDFVACQAQVQVVTADGRGPYRFSGSSTARVENGRIAEGWNTFDFLGLLTRMGAVPADAMAAALASASAAPRA